MPSRATVQSPAAWRFRQTGTGATGKLLSELFERIYTPEMFGAVGDDATDDTTAFDKAQTAAGSDGVVWLQPRRKYRVGELELLGGREWFFNGAIVRAADPDAWVFGVTSVSDITLRQGRIDGRCGDATSSTAKKKHSLYCRDSSDVTLEDFVLLNSAEDGAYFGSATVAHNGCTNTRFNNVLVKGASRNGIALVCVHGWAGQNLELRDTDDTTGAHSSGPWAGIDIEPDNDDVCDDVNICGIRTFDNAGNGVALYGLAGDTSGQQRITIEGHVSRGDARALRIARFPSRNAGSENVFKYRGISHSTAAAVTDGAISIEDLGDKTFVDIEAAIYMNSTLQSGIKLARASTGTYASISGTPKIRAKFSLFGRFLDVFSGGITDTDEFKDTEVSVDVRNATFTASGIDTDFHGRAWLLNGDTDALLREKTADATINVADVLGGTRPVANTSATGVLTHTLDNTSFATDQEAEFVLTGTHGLILELSDTSKVIYPWGAYRIACFERYGRVRLRKLSSGDWKAVACPLGQRGNWVLYGEATWDPGSIANGASSVQGVTVPGADRGCMTMASFTRDLAGLSLCSYGTGTDGVSVRLSNNSGGAVDLASGTLRVFAWRPGLTP